MAWKFFRRLLEGERYLAWQPRWAQLAPLDWPECILEVPVTDRFHAKQGRSIGRWKLAREGQELVVYLKRHYRLPRWHGLLALLWPEGRWSPARQEWDHLRWAQQQGLPVPAPLAVGEWIRPGGRLQSFLAVEELSGMVPLHEAIPAAATRLEPKRFAEWKRTLIDELVRLTRALHDLRWFHKDLYLCHFYVAEADTWTVPSWRGRVCLIDFHRLGHHPWTWRRWQAKDLGQLLYSSDVLGIGARDRLRFWRKYLGSERRGVLGRWLRWCILLKWRAYERHNRRKQQAIRSSGQAA